MERYAQPDYDINTPANLIPLRKDVLAVFDQRLFPTYVAHILEDSEQAGELESTLQNRPLQTLSKTAIPFLFARFAWAVIFSVKHFITKRIERKVIVYHSDKKEYTTETMKGADLYQRYGGGGTKKATFAGDVEDEAMEDDEDYL